MGVPLHERWSERTKERFLPRLISPRILIDRCAAAPPIPTFPHKGGRSSLRVSGPSRIPYAISAPLGESAHLEAHLHYPHHS